MESLCYMSGNTLICYNFVLLSDMYINASILHSTTKMHVGIKIFQAS